MVAFSVTQRLILLANTQVLALGSATWGALAEMHHQGQTERFNHRLTQLTRLTGVFAFLLLVPVAAATESFVGLWVGIERFGGGLLILATAAFVWIHTLSATLGLALDYNRPRAVDTADLLSGNPTERGGEHIRIALDRRGRPRWARP